VEAVKNVLGIAYFPDYMGYSELNIRKFLQAITGDVPTAGSVAPSGSFCSSAAPSTAPGAYETDSDIDDC
jgi:hypothetical protein